MSLIDSILSRTPGMTLYHYTSYGGFLGIIKNKSMWATNIHFQNDAEEFVHATNIARDVIRHKLEACADAQIRFFLERLMGALDQVSKIHIHVTSFSENGDLLSQWRGYCPKGSGVSIGFNYDDLRPVIEAQDFYFARCVYDKPNQDQLMQELLDEMIVLFDSARAKSSTDITNAIETNADAFMSKFASQAPIIKHPAFSEEREWRVISRPMPIDHPQIDFREGPLGLIPYFVLHLTNNTTGDIPIHEFIVGPNPQKEIASHAATLLLLHEKFKAWRPRLSKIPYRGW